MIRTWLGLVPADRRAKVIAYTALALLSVVVRAVATVLLVPLVGALFGGGFRDGVDEEPVRALNREDGRRVRR